MQSKRGGGGGFPSTPLKILTRMRGGVGFNRTPLEIFLSLEEEGVFLEHLLGERERGGWKETLAHPLPQEKNVNPRTSWNLIWVFLDIPLKYMNSGAKEPWTSSIIPFDMQ